MKIQLDFNNIKVKEQKKDFTVKILMLKGEKGDTGDLDQSKIVDNLTSNDSSKVLSAKQGKVLKDLVDKKPYYFNTVADMKAGNLSEGDMAITKGYYSANDGGGAIYTITSSANSNVHQEQLNNNFYSTIITFNNEINVNQLGAYGDGTHDDTNVIQEAIDKYNNIILLKGNYLVSDTLNIGSYTTLKGISINESIIIANPIKSFNIISLVDTYHSHIKNLTVDGAINIGNEVVVTNYNINGILLNYTSSKDGFNDIDNVKIENCTNIGLLVQHQKEGIFSNLIIKNCGNGLYDEATDCKYFNVVCYWNGIANINGNLTDGNGMYFKQYSNSNKIVNCKSFSNKGHGLYCCGSYNNFSNFEAQDNFKHGIYLNDCSGNNFNSITSSTNSTGSNDYNEIYMNAVRESYIEGNVVTRNISWSEHYAQKQLKVTDTCYNNKIELFYERNINKVSSCYDTSTSTCYNDIKINNITYGLKNILNEDILSDTNNVSGISNIFDSKNADSNDGTLEIDVVKGCQTINYANAQKVSPNGWLGLSKIIDNGFKVGNYINAFANFINNNETNLVCCIEARFYDSNDNELSYQRQWAGNSQIKFNKIIPSDTNKIKLSFLVLSNTLDASGIVDLYEFRAGIKTY